MRYLIKHPTSSSSFCVKQAHLFSESPGWQLEKLAILTKSSVVLRCCHWGGGTGATLQYWEQLPVAFAWPSACTRAVWVQLFFLNPSKLHGTRYTRRCLKSDCSPDIILEAENKLGHKKLCVKSGIESDQVVYWWLESCSVFRNWMCLPKLQLRDI